LYFGQNKNEFSQKTEKNLMIILNKNTLSGRSFGWSLLVKEKKAITKKKL
jgi:hypothetical protein